MPQKTLYFQNPRLLNQLYCARDENLGKVENAFGVKLTTREDWIRIQGEDNAIDRTETFFEVLNKGRVQGLDIRNSDFLNMLKAVSSGNGEALKNVFEEPVLIKLKKKTIVPKTVTQKKYIQGIYNNEIVFGIGPAGTGKTYLAVAAAIEALLQEKVEKVILTRPAVEAGEALGFLPGDLQEKIQPYLRPLYDALHEMLGHEQAQRLQEKNAIEIAPLAYMRGRTLSRAFIILDEAQNTTPEQMMMFLTRLGDGARMVITGDITQIDLPRSKNSGLKQAYPILKNTQGIEFFFFNSSDVVRHALVQDIIEAYHAYHNKREEHSKSDLPERSR